MKKSFKPKVVITIHGIRTRANWQKTISEIMSEKKIPIRNFDFGYFNLPKLLIPYYRNKIVDKFYDFYCTVIDSKRLKVKLKNPAKRPSVIAHSFGSYILCKCLEKYNDIKFDKVILCGSILPVEFDWESLLIKEQINSIRNEFSKKDVWTRFASLVVPQTGPSGFDGFITRNHFVIQQEFQIYKHSDYFKREHIENNWSPFLMCSPLSYYVLEGNSIADQNEFDRILNHIIKNDSNKAQHNLDLQNLIRWARTCPNIFSFLMERKKNLPKGYFITLPLKKKSFEQLKNGSLSDNNITESDIQCYEEKGHRYIFFRALNIDNDIRESSIELYNTLIKKLVNGFFIKIFEYAYEKNIKIFEIGSVASSEEKQQLCLSYKMKKIEYDKTEKPIYWSVITDDYLEKISDHSPIINKIRKVYKEIK